MTDRDHAEFEETCQHEQAEAEAVAAYLEKQRQTPGTLIHDATQLRLRSMSAVIDSQQSMIMQMDSDLHQLKRCHSDRGEMIHHPEMAFEIKQQQCEISLLRQQLRELRAWKDGTCEFFSSHMDAEDREAWEKAIRERMV
jgi:hypothetical protein